MNKLAITNNVSWLLVSFLFVLGCNGPSLDEQYANQDPRVDIDSTKQSDVCSGFFDYLEVMGCDGQVYKNPATSRYNIPLLAGTNFRMGLSNCSSSFHASDKPDAYAFDFNMEEGVEFTAARGGIVEIVVEDQSSSGGGTGNYVVVDHGDATFGNYLHSPKDGILVEVGDTIKQGQVLGYIGKSGLAGYPHLHFIVVKAPGTWPYEGIPITFKNVWPRDVVLESYVNYTSCEL